MLSIPGAFSVYRRDIYELAGGFDGGGEGDDLELTTRIHQRLRDGHRPYRVSFTPEPCCWTLVPGSYRRLARQRARWSQALAGALWAHRAMMLKSSYGVIGLLVLPFYVVFALVSGVMELLATAAIVAGLALGILDEEAGLVFAAAALGYGAFLTVVGVITEELTYNRYRSWRDFGLLLYAAIAENAGFRQAHAWWRLRGIADAVRHRTANRLAEPGTQGQSEAALGVAPDERHVQVP